MFPLYWLSFRLRLVVTNLRLNHLYWFFFTKTFFSVRGTHCFISLSLFNGIATFQGYLIPKSSCWRTFTYWPSIEPSIKRCTFVNKRKTSETGASGGRYQYHLDLWTWLKSVQMRTPTGSRRSWDNYITRCHRRLESVPVSQFEFQLVSWSWSWSQLGDKMPAWESACRLRACGPQWPAVEQPSQDEKEVLLWSEELWVNMWQSVPVSNSPLTHNQHQPFRYPFENKVWEVYFYKEVCSFVHWSSYIMLTMFPRIVVYVYV